ncbi:MAG: transglutaminase-like cysteine peptidase [Pseudomonadota bacterium]
MFSRPGTGTPRFATLGAALLVLCIASEAAAKPKARNKPIFDDLVTPSMLSQAAPVAPVKSSSQPRFFSINSVLAKLDGKPIPTDNVRLAAATPGVMSDAPPAIGGLSGSMEPYGLISFRAPEGVLWRKWRASETEANKELAALAACKSEPARCDQTMVRFQNMIGEVRGRTGRARIETANRLVNGAIRYTSDLIQHGVLDQWTSPLATLTAGRGDCEDYAIAKYVLLREAGVAQGDLRILLGRDKAAREDHAVLAVRDGASWIILDNRTMNTVEDTAARHFVPLYALDRTGVNLFASPYLSQIGSSQQNGVSPAAAEINADWGTTTEDSASSVEAWNDTSVAQPALSAEPQSPLLL